MQDQAYEKLHRADTEDNTLEGFSFYPNPAEDVLNIEAIQVVDQVVLYNLAGQKVLDQKIHTRNSQLSIGDLAWYVFDDRNFWRIYQYI